MTTTITVIESRVRKNKLNGRVQSLFGAGPIDPENWEVVPNGYTWEKVDHRGSVTVGLCRVPAKTIEDANAVALDYQKAIPNVVVNLMESK